MGEVIITTIIGVALIISVGVLWAWALFSMSKNKYR